MASVKPFWLLVPFILSLAFISSAPSLAGELTDAVKARDVARVRGLIATGADPNEKVRFDYPLNVAAVFGPAEMIATLLDAGADLEQPGRDGLHPLHNAVISGHRDIVALLIERGAVVDSKDTKGRTPLISFAANGGTDIEIAKILLAAGADPDIESAKDDDSDRALKYAAETGNLELAELLIAAHVDVNYRNFAGWSALHQAVSNNNLEIVRLLIAHGADVNLTNKMGFTALYYAQTDAAMRQLLVDAGAK